MDVKFAGLPCVCLELLPSLPVGIPRSDPAGQDPKLRRATPGPLLQPGRGWLGLNPDRRHSRPHRLGVLSAAGSTGAESPHQLPTSAEEVAAGVRKRSLDFLHPSGLDRGDIVLGVHAGGHRGVDLVQRDFVVAGRHPVHPTRENGGPLGVRDDEGEVPAVRPGLGFRRLHRGLGLRQGDAGRGGRLLGFGGLGAQERERECKDERAEGSDPHRGFVCEFGFVGSVESAAKAAAGPLGPLIYCFGQRWERLPKASAFPAGQDAAGGAAETEMLSNVASPRCGDRNPGCHVGRVGSPRGVRAWPRRSPGID